MPDNNTYDFIVTGAGSAGCAVAGRLSESGKYRVLLLEAGTKDTNPWIHVPLGYTKTYTDPKVNWMFDSEPEKELNGRTLYQPRGKVLGGTSSINGMVYMRGTPTDYDGWRQKGCEGWAYDDVLPFFKKAEDQERGPSEFHGADAVSAAHVFEPGALRARRRNGAGGGRGRRPGQRGFQRRDAGGGRLLPDDDHQPPALVVLHAPLSRSRRKGRANLTIATEAHATRILFEGNKAVGVEYQTPSGKEVAWAKGEIVASGGVYGSPQLLQLSGIGPGELLQEFGVPVVRDMEGVGKHLHDHFNTYLVWRCSQKVTLNDLAASPLRKLTQGMQYVFTRSGQLANAGIYAGAFVKSDPRLEQPDLQINMFGWSAFERLRTGIKPHPFSAFTMSPVHLRPEGRGTVKIKSADPLSAPAIRFNFLASEYDFQALIYGTRFSRKIAEQAALKPFIVEEVIPGPQCQTDDQIKEEIRVRGVSNLHPVGTCRMGREIDSVVDPRLRVHGIERLRVADASIMPQVPGGNTNAPSIMIGEKCAAMILEDARAA